MQEEKLRANLITLTNGFAEANGLMVSTVLARASGDARFLERTGSAGKSFTVRVYDNLVQWFSDRWPEGIEWPADIPRPDRTGFAA